MKIGGFVLIIIVFCSQTLRAQLNKDLFLNAGRNHLIEEQYFEAIENFNKVIYFNPDDYFTYFLRGIAKYQLGDYRGAEYDFSKVIEINPLHSHAYHYRGISRDRLGDYSNALDDFQKALDRNPRKENIYISRGFTKLHLNKFFEAIEDFNLAIKKNPNDPIAYINRAIAYDETGEPEKAIEDCNKAIKLNFYLGDAFFQRARIKYNLQNFIEAKEDMELAIKRNEKDPRYYYFLALIHIKLENDEEALRNFSQVLLLDPNNALTFYNRAIIKTKKKDYDGALKDYNEVIRLNPRNILTYLNRAIVKYEMQDYKGAIEDYSLAIELYPDFARAYMYRAEAKRKINDFKGAEKDYYIAQSKINKFNNDTSMFANIDSTYVEKIIELNADFENASIDKNTKFLNETIFIEPEPMFMLTFFEDKSNYIKSLKENYDVPYAEFKDFKIINDLFFVITNQDTSITLEQAGTWLDNVASDLNENDMLMINFCNGLINSKLQNYYSAINFFDKVIYQNAGLDYVYMNRAVLKMKNLQAVNNENNYVESLTFGKGDNIYQSNKTIENKPDYSDIMHDLDMQLAINPESEFGYFNRGYVKQMTQKYDEAIEDYTKAIKKNVQLKEAYFNRALLLIYLNETKSACLDLSRAGELGLVKAYKVIKRYCND